MRATWLPLVICCLLPSLAVSTPHPIEPIEPTWSQELVLVSTANDEIGTIQAARVAIQLAGGQVALMSPTGLIMARFPQSLDQDLLDHDSIQGIHRDELPELDVSKRAAEGQLFARSFNNFVSGDYQRKWRIKEQRKSEISREPVPDVFTPDPADFEQYLENLKAKGLDPRELEARGLLDAGNKKGASAIMSGLVSTTIFFPESDGSGGHPDLYTWTEEDVQSYVNDANFGLLFWAERGDQFNCWVAFMVRYIHPTDPRSQTEYEAVLIPNDIDLLVEDLLDNHGFSGNHFTQTYAYNSWQCATYGADRAYCAFVGYNPPPAGGSLPGGAVAWAYLFGPYTYLLFRPDGGNPDGVYAHEIGHIFGACDEYASSNCGCSEFCSNGVLLGNCENCQGYAACMMGDAIYTLCNFTDGHVGWRINPCAPPPLPAPTAFTLNPTSGLVGTEVEITITGQNFFYGTFVDMGPDVTVVGSEFIDANTVKVTVSIDGLAEPDLRDVEVLNRDLQSDTLLGAFQLIPTPRHYMSAGGSNTYPYLTPADAANTIADAMGAAGPGDSVLVDIAPLTNVDLNVTRRVELVGGWSNNFQTRSPGDRTHLSVINNIRIQEESTLDGLEITDGFGRFETDPLTGYFGGGVVVRNSSVTIRDCYIHSNTADDASGNGGGGGVYVFNSSIEMYDSVISGNSTQNGGGIYIRNGSGTLSRNTITGNIVTHLTSGTDGAGVYVVDSSNLLFEDNIINTNTGADNGAAMYFDNSTAITVRRGTISASIAANNGGGIALIGSDATVEDVTFDGNDGIIGGAIYSDATSTLTATGNTFRANTAQLGAGVHQSTSAANLNHNVFEGNTAQFTGSAIFANGIGSGSILGNTMDGNITQISGGAAVMLSASSVSVQHNIISNSSHYGAFCSGGASTLSFNLFHNNPDGDADGCGAAKRSIIVGDPLFVDAAGGDFHLGLDSPGIDAADPVGGFDDPDGSRGDLGRYGTHSFVMDQPVYPKNVVADASGGDVIVSWDANPEGDLASYAIYGGTASGFVPNSGNRLALVAAPSTNRNLGPQPGITHIKVSAVDTDGYASGYSTEATVDTQTSSDPLPEFASGLRGIVPNPFNPTTRINYEVGTPGRVRLDIYDVTGRLVRTLVDAELGPGRYDVTWHGRDQSGSQVASGVYFSQLSTVDRKHTQKLTLLK